MPQRMAGSASTKWKSLIELLDNRENPLGRV
jgi:hypothetical protein